MIDELDAALRTLVEQEVLNGSGVEVQFDAPTKDWAARRNQPTIDIYLYDIRQDLSRRQFGIVEQSDETGTVAARRGPHVVPGVVPRHGVDAAPRGRAPPALRAALVLPAPRTGPPRPADRLAGRARDERAALGGAAATTGPGPLRRLVGARRRAEAVARHQRHRADAARRLRRGRPARHPGAGAHVRRPDERCTGGRRQQAGTGQPAPAGARDRPPAPAAPSTTRPGLHAAAAAPRSSQRPSRRRRRRWVEVAGARPRCGTSWVASTRSPSGSRPSSTGAGPPTRPSTTRSSASTSPTTRSTRCSRRAAATRRCPKRTPAAAAAERRRRGGGGALAAASRSGAQAALDEVDEELLLVAAAPDIDERFEAFYGFLNDDVTRRRATVGPGAAAGRAVAAVRRRPGTG